MNEFDKLLIEKIRDRIVEKLVTMGYELVDIELLSGPRGRTLRVFIDKEGGVNIKDCEKVSYLIDKDIEDIMVVEETYFLEVSSPGLTRKLKTLRDFEKEKGNPCKIVLKDMVDGQMSIKGKIDKVDGNVIYLDTNRGQIKIDFENIKRANLDF